MWGEKKVNNILKILAQIMVGLFVGYLYHRQVGEYIGLYTPINVLMTIAIVFSTVAVLELFLNRGTDRENVNEDEVVSTLKRIIVNIVGDSIERHPGVVYLVRLDIKGTVVIDKILWNEDVWGEFTKQGVTIKSIDNVDDDEYREQEYHLWYMKGKDYPLGKIQTTGYDGYGLREIKGEKLCRLEKYIYDEVVMYLEFVIDTCRDDRYLDFYMDNVEILRAVDNLVQVGIRINGEVNEEYGKKVEEALRSFFDGLEEKRMDIQGLEKQQGDDEIGMAVRELDNKMKLMVSRKRYYERIKKPSGNYNLDEDINDFVKRISKDK